MIIFQSFLKINKVFTLFKFNTKATLFFKKELAQGWFKPFVSGGSILFHGSMDPFNCVNGISSGELLYRSLIQDKKSWLNRKVGQHLRQFLEEGVNKDSILSKFEARRDELIEAEELCLRSRKNRSKLLRAKIAEANELCKIYLSRAKLTNEEFNSTLSALMNEFDDHASKYALWYFATLERERSIHRGRLGEELMSCDSLQKHLKSSLRLNIFAIHLESETDRQILLKRLPSSHPQHIRCRRAASENLKPGFFDGVPSFSGLNVLDVYKVENKPLLERFQKCAALMEPGKVKGLFTSVPAHSVERTVVLGFGSNEGRPGEKVAMADAEEYDEKDIKNLAKKRKIFRRAWYAFHDKGDGYAEKIVDGSTVSKFPRTFSRYSTVEVDRYFVSEAHRENTEPGLDLSADKVYQQATSTWERSTDGGGPVSSDIRYLILCRVVIGKVFVTSKEYRGFPSIGKTPAFDSMYNPLQEEYLVLRPEQVLPEFVIQYTYSKEASSAAKVHKSNPILPIDLSTASVKVPDTAWNIEISAPSVAGGANDKSNQKKDQKNDEGTGSNNNRIVPPLATTKGIRLAAVPLDRTSAEEYAGESADTMIDLDLAEAKLGQQSLDVSRRESLTSWEQLRLNAARQRETILDTSDGLHAAYKRKVTQTRHWESARLRETFANAPELESVQSLKYEIDRSEKDLIRQVARRREMENEMNSMRRKRGGRPLPGTGGRR